MKSIGVEICEFTDPQRRVKAEQNAAELIRGLVSLTNAEVVQHFKWTGKNCPRVIRARNRWEEFLRMVNMDWKAVVMKRLLDEGIISGQHDSDKPITWAEMAAVVGKVLDKIGGEK